MTRRLEHGRCEAAVSLCGPFSQFKGSFIAGRAWSLRRSVFEELRANRALLFAGSDSASWRDCERVVTIFVGRGAPPYDFERPCAISWPFQRAATRILGTSPMRAVPGTDCDLSATVRRCRLDQNSAAHPSTVPRKRFRLGFPGFPAI